MDYVQIGLSAAIFILLIANIIIASKKNSKDNGEELKDVASKIQHISEEINRQNDKVSASLVETKTRLEAVEKNEKEGLKEVSEQLEKFSKQNYEQITQMRDGITRTLSDIRDKNDKDQEQSRKVLQENLDKMRETVDEKLSKTLNERLDSSFKTVSDQLENVYKSLGEVQKLSGDVTSNVGNLNKLLSNVKTRGTWGESQLKGILDDIIPTLYEENIATNPNKPTCRVEFAVRIPAEDGKGTILMPVDSKFPMEDYARMVDAQEKGDIDVINEMKKALKTRVLDEAKSINGYINTPDTTPFAVMYLATEGLYAEIVSDSELVEKVRNKNHIFITGPSTIAALLSSLSIGFKTIAINRKAEEVWKTLSETKTQYEKFGGLLDKANKKIEEAGKAVGEALKRNNIIDKRLKNVEQLDAKEAAALEETITQELPNTDILDTDED